MQNSEEPVTIIDANRRWKRFELSELLRYKDLFRFRVINQYKAQQRQTVLSYLWVFLDPAINILFFTIVFGGLVKVDTNETPYVVFNTASMAGWLFLKNAMNFSVLSLNAEKILLQKIYFPRIMIPIIPVVVYLPNFLIQLILSLVLIAFWGFYPGWELFYVVPQIFVMFLLSAGFGMLISSFVVQFRDLELIWRYFLQFAVYLIPVAYPIESVHEAYQGIYTLNPMVYLIEGFRVAMIGGAYELKFFIYPLVFSLVLLFVGTLIYKSREPLIVDAL
ncbi:MAG: ABC transporter permease [Opitutales bacterium]|nr:ABC transporter permease [Opitutales bacterium]